MTTSKTPPDPDQHVQQNDQSSLGNSIDALENMITNPNSEQATPTDASNIPVLDDIVEPGSADFSDTPESPGDSIPTITDQAEPTEKITREQITELVNNMEGKITGELDSLIHILRDAIKDSIMTELKTQLESEVDQINTPKHETDD